MLGKIRWGLVLVFAGMLVALSNCDTTSVGGAKVQCVKDSDCPDGFACFAGTCKPSGDYDFSPGDTEPGLRDAEPDADKLVPDGDKELPPIEMERETEPEPEPELEPEPDPVPEVEPEPEVEPPETDVLEPDLDEVVDRAEAELDRIDHEPDPVAEAEIISERDSDSDEVVEQDRDQDPEPDAEPEPEPEAEPEPDQEEQPCTVYYADRDNDGYGDPNDSQCLIVPADPYTATVADDCDDSRNDVNPEAQEVCDGADNNCNGSTDEEGALGCTPYYTDADHDGFGVGDPRCLCAPSGDYRAEQSGDCDDTRDNVHPGAQEVCDGFDNDCNGSTDDNLTPEPCPLQDGVCAGSTKRCGGELGWLDCTPDDYGPDYEPEETRCDNLDNDCDGSTDEGCVIIPCPITCTDDQECLQYGLDTCYDGFCTKECSPQDDDCPLGYACREVTADSVSYFACVCNWQAEACPQTCTNDFECIARGFDYCDYASGTCVKSCQDDHDCPRFHKCDLRTNVCACDYNVGCLVQCVNDDDCKEETDEALNDCRDGFCTKRCRSDEDCPGDMFCNQDQRCECPVSPPECSEPCLSAAYCQVRGFETCDRRGQVCVRDCSYRSPECPVGYACYPSAGCRCEDMCPVYCTPGGSGCSSLYGPEWSCSFVGWTPICTRECDTNTDCAVIPGYECIDGVCQCP